MKIRKIIFALLMTLVITSCGKKQETSDSINTDTAAIESSMADYSERGEKSSEDGVNEISNDTPDDDAPTVASASSNNWDSVLDEYEKYCTKVISLSKKAMGGDMSVMTEYSSTLEQAQRLADKLENAEGDMTPAQVARLNKIASKMAQGVM